LSYIGTDPRHIFYNNKYNDAEYSNPNNRDYYPDNKPDFCDRLDVLEGRFAYFDYFVNLALEIRANIRTTVLTRRPALGDSPALTPVRHY